MRLCLKLREPGDRLALTGPFRDAVGSLDDSFGFLGFAVVADLVPC